MIVITLRINYWIFALVLMGIVLTAFVVSSSPAKPVYKFPYSQSVLSDKKAAAHLLSRFSYGATPGQVENVVNIGLENWFQQQLTSELPDEKLNSLLTTYDALKLSNTEIVNTYQKN